MSRPERRGFAIPPIWRPWLFYVAVTLGPPVAGGMLAGDPDRLGPGFPAHAAVTTGLAAALTALASTVLRRSRCSR